MHPYSEDLEMLFTLTMAIFKIYRINLVELNK